jgi:hypothetical protein
LIALVAVTGCSSSYQPANSPRIAVGMSGGTQTYFKDGREYPGGFFGGGAIDAVQGNPRAVAEAEKGHGLMIAGFTVSLIGLGGVIAGVAVAPNQNTSDDTAALALMLGGLGVSIVGAILAANAYPHYYDAIAIYNDGVPPQPPMYQLQPPPMYNPQAPPPGYNPQAPPPEYNPQAPPPAPQAPPQAPPPAS